jgi:hypothetical protein
MYLPNPELIYNCEYLNLRLVDIKYRAAKDRNIGWLSDSTSSSRKEVSTKIVSWLEST